MLLLKLQFMNMHQNSERFIFGAIYFDSGFEEAREVTLKERLIYAITCMYETAIV